MNPSIDKPIALRVYNSIAQEQEAHYQYLRSLSWEQRVQLAVASIKRMYPDWDKPNSQPLVLTIVKGQ
jgi:hypothetical protein